MKILQVVALAAAAGCLAACSPSSNVGLLNLQRITANWPKFQSYQQSLQSDVQAIETSKLSTLDKQRNEQALQIKYGQTIATLTQQIKDAAQQVAQKRSLKLVVTQEGVGYGGVDITPDVEKILGVTETATPTP